MPVSQILGRRGSAGEGELSGILCLTGGEVRVLRSDSGGGFSISAELRLLLRAYRTVRCSCVEDLYSIRRPVQLHQETVAVPVGRPCRSLREESIQHLDFGGSRPFFFITDTDCTPAAVTEEGGQTALRTTIHTRLLYLDEADAPAVTERTEEIVVPVQGPVQSVSCTLAGPPDVRFTGSGCDVRQVAEFLIGDMQADQMRTVAAVELLDGEEQEKIPSLVLRRLLPEETLWDVAKQYRTDEELLRTVNHLEEGETPDKMLLIPRTRYSTPRT